LEGDRGRRAYNRVDVPPGLEIARSQSAPCPSMPAGMDVKKSAHTSQKVFIYGRQKCELQGGNCGGACGNRIVILCPPVPVGWEKGEMKGVKICESEKAGLRENCDPIKVQRWTRIQGSRFRFRACPRSLLKRRPRPAKPGQNLPRGQRPVFFCNVTSADGGVWRQLACRFKRPRDVPGVPTACCMRRQVRVWPNAWPRPDHES